MASDVEFFGAKKKYGRQWGTLSLRKICARSARMVRDKSWASASGALRPLTVRAQSRAFFSGKNQTRNCQRGARVQLTPPLSGGSEI
jgi:hypothetical protein